MTPRCLFYAVAAWLLLMWIVVGAAYLLGHML